MTSVVVLSVSLSPSTSLSVSLSPSASLSEFVLTPTLSSLPEITYAGVVNLDSRIKELDTPEVFVYSQVLTPDSITCSCSSFSTWLSIDA